MVRRPPRSAEPSEEDVFYYVAFVQHFVLGRMNVSDSIYQQKEAAVERVAAHLRAARPLKRTPLYRGWLVEPEKVSGGRILVEHDIPISFSHDRGVACFFADPRSMISDFLAARRPRARGYVMTLTDWSPSQVLWAYEWDGHIPTGYPGFTMELVAGSIQGIDAGAKRAIESNLRSQKELILKPLSASAKTKLEPLDDADCPPTGELNRRYG